MRENENIFVSIHLGVYHWLMNNFGFSHLFAGKPHIYFGFKKTSLTPGLLFGFLSINLKSCGFVQMRFIRTLPTYPCRRIGHLRWLIVKRSLHVYVSAKKIVIFTSPLVHMNKIRLINYFKQFRLHQKCEIMTVF